MTNTPQPAPAQARTKTPVLQMVGVYPPTQKELEERFEIHRLDLAASAQAQHALIEQLAPHCQAVVTSGGKGINAVTMAQLPHLKFVSCFGVGVDAIDLEYAKAHGIAVTNTPDVLTEDVADLAVALMLAAVRQIPQGDRFVREGQWLKGGMALTRSVQGMKVGVVGMGRIGQAIAHRVSAFKTQIAYFGPRAKPVQWPHFVNLKQMAQWADVLIAALPGGKHTEKAISREVLQALGPEGVLVNIARGSVVDQDAMVELLQSGALGGAALDVFVNEPHVPASLIDVPRIVLHPHQGSATHSTRTAMGRLTIDNLAAFVEGKPLLTPVV